MDPSVSSAFQALLCSFAPAFTVPSFQNFVTLVTGWILCTGRHTISRVIQFSGGTGRRKHHSTLYRFFSRGAWVPDALGQVLLGMVLLLIPGVEVYASVDDMLCRKSGPHLWGAGMHHDPLRSTYGRGRGRHVAFAFGWNWVVLSLWVPLPWGKGRGVAVPILLRLYRSKKLSPASLYRKRTELAAEMIGLLASWLPKGRRLVVVGDMEYACRTVVQSLPDGVTFIGPMGMDAALYDTPQPRRGRGRPRTKGKRLPSPRQLAEDPKPPWERRTLTLYGRRVEILMKSRVCLWYRVAGKHPVRLIVTRDPKGRIEDRAYFTTDPAFGVGEIARGFSRRWSEEQMHRDVKQSLGIEDPQNGWWRRPRGRRARVQRAGPQPHARRGSHAVLRTAPLAFLAYALVVLWYLRHGSPGADVAAVRRRAPWYRHKVAPSFADMLAAARRDLWASRISAKVGWGALRSKIVAALPACLIAA